MTTASGAAGRREELWHVAERLVALAQLKNPKRAVEEALREFLAARAHQPAPAEPASGGGACICSDDEHSPECPLAHGEPEFGSPQEVLDGLDRINAHNAALRGQPAKAEPGTPSVESLQRIIEQQNREREAIIAENKRNYDELLERVAHPAKAEPGTAAPFPDDPNSLKAFAEWWNKPMFREGLNERQVAYMAFYFGRDWQGRRGAAPATADTAAGLREALELYLATYADTDKNPTPVQEAKVINAVRAALVQSADSPTRPDEQ